MKRKKVKGLKIRSVDNIEDFIDAVQKCSSDVYLSDWQVDNNGQYNFYINLKSPLCLYVGIGKLLEEYGERLSMPFARHLEDGIYELRIPQGSHITRLLYFFCIGDRAIVTNGFVKKTQRTPRREIEKAKRYRDDWRMRYDQRKRTPRSLS